VYGKIKRIHFVGIGGIGMSGIVEAIAEYGLYGFRLGLKRVGHG
jgi:UDP-N-acetylmuramate-alanine ligase